MNISLFFDGTTNNADATYSTNVKKLCDLCISDEGNLPHYEAGPGGSGHDTIFSVVFGYTEWRIIKNAYSYLSKAYKPGFDIHLFLFGFSRGAYIARIFSWLLQECGIPENTYDIDQLVNDFHKGRPKDPTIKCSKLESIEMIGVWDTVKMTFDRGFPDQKLPPIVKKAYHAMALDEASPLFPSLKWDKGDERIEQIWFAGVHSDVGGGYQDSGLSDITLQWMMSKASPLGLALKSEFIKGDSLGTLHAPLGRIIEAPRIFDGENVYGSVETRIEKIEYKPAAAGFPEPPEKPRYIV